MPNALKKINKSVSIAILIIAVGLVYNVYAQTMTSRKLSETKSEFATTTSALEQKISDIEVILLAAQEENVTLSEALSEAKASLEERFADVNENVENLEKITTTDPELLQKYSKIYFLNEHYVPADLQTIPSKYTYDKNRKYEIHDDVWPYLKDLLDDANDDGLNLMVISAFRSFGEQAQLKGAYTITYGAGTANQFSADQGYSEHQLGTTVDFTNPTVAATYSGFAASDEYAWLRENAHKYGFTLSYPENNSFYEFEPWHWRFVGKKLARDLWNDEKYFYDLSQREIDGYIVDLFD